MSVLKGNIISNSGGNNNSKLIRRSTLAERLLYLDGKPFSLNDYIHMKTIYDINFEQLVLKTSRQVSKCGRKSFIYNNLPESPPKMAKDLKPGDELLSYNESTGKIVRNKIKAIEDNGVHPIYQIKTRTGSVIEVTGNHPIWTYGWTNTEDLKVGDLVGISRNTEAALPTEKIVQDHEYKIVGYLLAEGSLSYKSSIGFTNSEKDIVKEFSEAVTAFHPKVIVKPKGKAKYQYHCTATSLKNNPLLDWTRKIGIQGHNSQTKFHPDLVYKLTKEQLCDYIRIWFDTDGYVSLRPNGVQIEIALISKKLIDGLRDLLSRLGIFSSISEKKVKIYEGIDKKCWCLRVEGRDSKLRFYELIKTKKLKEVSWPETENNNRLVYHKNVVKSIIDKHRYNNFGINSMYSNGLQASPSYDVSQTKMAKYCEVLEDPELEIMYNGDIIYDRITEINILPPEETIAIEMEDPHKNFLMDHIVTHNSTTLANLIVLYSITYPHFRTMFVAPRQDQTKVFSRDRLGPTMQNSPAIKAYFLDPKLDQNVFYRQFKNGSKVYLRYAYHDADALRGFSTDLNAFDECFTPNVEILTKSGWVSADSIHDSLEFATHTGEYQKASRIIEKYYEDDIIKILGIEVTKGHNLRIFKEGVWLLMPAIKAINMKNCFIDIDGSLVNLDFVDKLFTRYEGKVYCATVPNGTLVVRDKIEKTPVIMGNCQDLVEDVIPVANQTMTRSEFKKEIYSGTPKRTQGTLSDRWFKSTQNEWALKCSPCGHWNVPIDETNIGSHGIICSKCGKSLNPSNGQWVITGDADSRMIGFRVCAPMFANAPWVNWQKDIIEYRKNFGEAKFYNEVMGLEYDDGVAPITQTMLRKACNEDQEMTDQFDNRGSFVMGVDYGPINSTNSYTYVAIGKWINPDIFQFTYFKKYYGKEADPVFYHNDIAKKFVTSKSIRIGADYGMGEASNSEIRNRIGYDKLIAYQLSDSVKQMSQYNPKIPGYILNKSKVLDSFIDALNNDRIRFPRWTEFRAHEREFLNLNLEFDERFNKRKYTKIGTDDGLMAAVFCWMAAQIVRNSL